MAAGSAGEGAGSNTELAVGYFSRLVCQSEMELARGLSWLDFKELCRGALCNLEGDSRVADGRGWISQIREERWWSTFADGNSTVDAAEEGRTLPDRAGGPVRARL